MKRKLFRVTALEEGNFYLIRFPDHPDLFTQATHIREVEKMSKDLIYLMLGIPVEEIELKVEYISAAAITL